MPMLPVVFYDLDDQTYLENSGIITVDDSFYIVGGGNFTGGFLDYSISEATSTETLGLQSDSAPSDVAGVVSIVGSTIFRGTGAGHEAIGTVSGTYNGENGVPLRINFTNAFENGDFSEGSDGSTLITGWTTQVNEGNTSRVHLDGVYEIAGQPTPVDSTYPANNSNADQSTGGNFVQQAYLDDTGSEDYAIRLNTGSASIVESYGVIRGPYVYSNGTVALEEGDTVTFDWKALAGGDAYDAYGYIINVNTGDTITILDETGSSDSGGTDWATETITIGADEGGTYRFVFVAGSYDFTGGKYLGGELLIDDVSVTQANPPQMVTTAEVNQIIDRLTYENTADDFASLNRILNITAEDAFKNSGSDQSLITIIPVNDAPTFDKGADQVVNEDAGLQIIQNWATNIDTIEVGQTFSFILSSDNSDLFSIQPIINSGGDLLFKTADDAYGTATVSVYMKDNGGTANGGEDTSAVQTFTITVTRIDAPPLVSSNDAPPEWSPGWQAPQGNPVLPPTNEPEPTPLPDPQDLEDNPAQPPAVQPPGDFPPDIGPFPPFGGAPQVTLMGIPLFEDFGLLE